MGPGGTLTRRSLIATLACATAALAGCNQPADDGVLLASAARGNDRRSFVDSVSWMETDNLTAVIVFTPYKLSDEQRRDVLEARSVYPTLPTSDPVLEMRLEIRPGRRTKDIKINTSTLRSIQFTYWYFDDPTPVVRVEESEKDWPSTPDIEVIGLDGEMRKGGWAVGTVRARQLHKGSRSGEEAYLVNVKFIISLA